MKNVKRSKINLSKAEIMKNRCRQLTARIVPFRYGYLRHHWTYELELAEDIIYLKPCFHGLVHKNMSYDETSLIFRAKKIDIKCYKQKIQEYELLDTKYKHMRWLIECIRSKRIFQKQHEEMLNKCFDMSKLKDQSYQKDE
jgi:hypothetical protein